MKRSRAMAQVLVRDLNEGVLEKLEKWAKQHRHSLEFEIRAILMEAADAPVLDHQAIRKRIEEIRGRLQIASIPDSADLIREDRDR
jgi:plasmid stability protein